MDTDLAETLRAKRESAGLSVKQLSEITGIPRTTLIRCLNEPDEFKVRQFLAVARAVNLRTLKVA